MSPTDSHEHGGDKEDNNNITCSLGDGGIIPLHDKSRSRATSSTKIKKYSSPGEEPSTRKRNIDYNPRHCDDLPSAEKYMRKSSTCRATEGLDVTSTDNRTYEGQGARPKIKKQTPVGAHQDGLKSSTSLPSTSSNLVPSGPKCVSAWSERVNKQTNKQTRKRKIDHDPRHCDDLPSAEKYMRKDYDVSSRKPSTCRVTGLDVTSTNNRTYEGQSTQPKTPVGAGQDHADGTLPLRYVSNAQCNQTHDQEGVCFKLCIYSSELTSSLYNYRE